MLQYIVDLLRHPWALPALALLLLCLLVLGYRSHRRARNPLAQNWEGGTAPAPPTSEVEERAPPD